MKEEKPSLKDKLGRVTPKWNFPLWYVPMMILLLWLWQGAFSQLTVKTIPYSEFKTYIGRGDVTEAMIKQDEVVGTIKSKLEPAKSEPTAPAKAGKEITEKEEPKLSDTEKTFLFRTIRVED